MKDLTKNITLGIDQLTNVNNEQRDLMNKLVCFITHAYFLINGRVLPQFSDQGEGKFLNLTKGDWEGCSKDLCNTLTELICKDQIKSTDYAQVEGKYNKLDVFRLESVLKFVSLNLHLLKYEGPYCDVSIYKDAEEGLSKWKQNFDGFIQKSDVEVPDYLKEKIYSKFLEFDQIQSTDKGSRKSQESSDKDKTCEVTKLSEVSEELSKLINSIPAHEFPFLGPNFDSLRSDIEAYVEDDEKMTNPSNPNSVASGESTEKLGPKGSHLLQ